MKRSVRRDGSKASGFLLGAGLVLFGLSSTYFVLQDSPEFDSAPSPIAAEPHDVANAMLDRTPLAEGVPSAQEALPLSAPVEVASVPVPPKKAAPTKKSMPTDAEPAPNKAPTKQAKPSKKSVDDPEDEVKPGAGPKPPAVKDSFKPTPAAVKIIDEVEKEPASKKEPTPKATPAKPKSEVDAPVPVKAEVVGEKPFAPKVLMATETKAWVQTDPLKTVIVEKNQSIPGLGEFKGADGNVAKFDGKAIPIENAAKKESDK